MNKNIVFGVGSEIGRINSSGLIVTAINTQSISAHLVVSQFINTTDISTTAINLPVNSTSTSAYGPFGSSIRTRFQIVGNLVTLEVDAIANVMATSSGVVNILLPPQVKPELTLWSNLNGVYSYVNQNTTNYQIAIWYTYSDEFEQVWLALTAGVGSSTSDVPFISGIYYYIPRFTISYIL
jgi:hypothetical protein